MSLESLISEVLPIKQCEKSPINDYKLFIMDHNGSKYILDISSELSEWDMKIPFLRI